METADLDTFEQWFDRYTAGFRFADADDQRNIELKIHHTRQVRALGGYLAREMGLPARIRRYSEAAGLFHDIGRFRQFEQYGTFRDPDSVNHAWLSLVEANRSGIWRRLSIADRHRLSKAVLFHNRKELPERLRGETRLLCCLLRDADKLDILRLFDEYDRRPEGSSNPVIELGLEEPERVTQASLNHIAAGRIPDYRELVTAGDFRLLRASWVFDLNFFPAVALFKSRNHLERIAEGLQPHPKLEPVLDRLRAYTARRLRERSNLCPIPYGP